MKRFILSALFFVALLSIWHLLVLAKIWSPVLLPDPISVWEYLKGAAGDGTLVQASLVTMRRLLAGYVIGIAAGLPLGVDDKLFISLSGSLPGIEPDMFLVGSTNSRETMTYQVRPLDRPAIYTFFGGRFAAALEREGQGAVFSFAAGELARLQPGCDASRVI